MWSIQEMCIVWLRFSIDARNVDSQEMTSVSEIEQYMLLYAVMMCIPVAMFALRKPRVVKNVKISDRG
jgi:hypothetical protein